MTSGLGRFGCRWGGSGDRRCGTTVELGRSALLPGGRRRGQPVRRRPRLAGQPGHGQPSYRRAGGALRSEEHTSELQSLMRISYAVFCLKKKKIYIQKVDNSITIKKQHRVARTLQQ